MIGEARADEKAVALAKQRAEAYLALPDTKLETKREFVDNCFLLDQIFRRIMTEANCRCNHHQRLHVHDHAQGAHLGLPHVEHCSMTTAIWPSANRISS